MKKINKKLSLCIALALMQSVYSPVLLRLFLKEILIIIQLQLG